MSVSKHVTKGVRQEWEVASSMSGLSTTSKAMAPNCPLWPWVFSVSPAKKSPSICFNSLFIRFSVVFNSHGLKAWFPEGGSANWPSDFERKYPETELPSSIWAQHSHFQKTPHNTTLLMGLYEFLWHGWLPHSASSLSHYCPKRQSQFVHVNNSMNNNTQTVPSEVIVLLLRFLEDLID
jgi:hypothetical protein